MSAREKFVNAVYIIRTEQTLESIKHALVKNRVIRIYYRSRPKIRIHAFTVRDQKPTTITRVDRTAMISFDYWKNNRN